MNETLRRLSSNSACNKYKREKEQYNLSYQKPKVKTRVPNVRWNNTIEPKPTGKRSKPHGTHNTARYRGQI